MLKTKVDHKNLVIPNTVSSGGKKGPVMPVENRYEQVGHPEPWHQPADEVTEAGLAVSGLTVRWTMGSYWRPFKNWADFSDHFSLFARSMALEGVFSMLLPVAVVTMVSLSVGPESFAVRSFLVGLTSFIAILYLLSHRITANLPRLLYSSLIAAETLHKAIDFPIMMGYLIVNLGFACLGGLILSALGGGVVPNFAATLRPVSQVGAVFIEILCGTLIVWTYMHNKPLDAFTFQMNSEKNTKTAGFNRMNFLVAGAHGLCTMVTFANGLWTHGNVAIYLGGAIATGTWDVPAGSNWWAYEIFVIPISSALLGWLLHLLSWNMNGLTQEQFVEYAQYQAVKRGERKGEIKARISAALSQV